MNKKIELLNIIASDKYNILQDNESLFSYTIKKIYYKIINIIKSS